MLKTKNARNHKQKSQFANSANDGAQSIHKTRNLRSLPSAEELLIRDASAKRLIDIRDSDHRLRDGHREFTKYALTSMYAVARFLRDNKKAWLEFCRHPDWNGRKKTPRCTDQNNALRFVTKFASGHEGKPAAKRASRNFKRLQNFWVVDASILTVEEELKRGISRLDVKSAKKGPRKREVVRIRLGRRDLSRTLHKLDQIEVRIRVLSSKSAHHTVYSRNFRPGSWKHRLGTTSGEPCYTLIIYNDKIDSARQSQNHER